MPISIRSSYKDICDFCNSTPVVVSYPCKDFVVDYIFESVGAFAACDICYQLIELNKWKTLLKRSITKYMKKHPDDYKREVEIFIGQVHNGFRTHRILDR